MAAGHVSFVGCGPGAADLLTLRAARSIAQADVIVWSPALIDRAVLGEHARTGAEIVAWPPATQADVLAAYERAATDGLRVVRLKGGDPTLFGELADDVRAVGALDVEWEIVPGISAVAAGAAALRCEIAGRGAPLLLTAGTGDGGDGGAGVVATLGIGDPAALERDLAARGMPACTPCAVLVAITRPGEVAATCRLDELAECVDDFGARGLTTVLAGAPLALAALRKPH
jgi:precorrin-4/cobalt-precorrin-4 C11-methyltransferase